MQLGYIQITPLAVESEHTFNELFVERAQVPTFRRTFLLAMVIYDSCIRA